MKYGIALKRKIYVHGLMKEEVMMLFDLLDDDEAFPIEFESGDIFVLRDKFYITKKLNMELV